MKKLGNKGYSIQDMAPLAIAFVVVAVVLSMGGQILGDISDTQTANTYESNATVSGLTSISTLSGWLPTIAIVVAAAIVIGVLLTYFAIR